MRTSWPSGCPTSPTYRARCPRVRFVSAPRGFCERPRSGSMLTRPGPCGRRARRLGHGAVSSRPPWWMLIIAALFIGYHVLLLYSDLTRPEPAGFVFGIHESAIVVRAVAPGSRAARAGLAVGDRVLTANSHPVRSRLDWSSGASWTHFRAARRLLWHRILRRNRCWMAARPPGPAASIDRQAGSHTVHIQFDDAVPVAQQWFDSVSSQEL